MAEIANAGGPALQLFLRLATKQTFKKCLALGVSCTSKSSCVELGGLGKTAILICFGFYTRVSPTEILRSTVGKATILQLVSGNPVTDAFGE